MNAIILIRLFWSDEDLLLALTVFISQSQVNTHAWNLSTQIKSPFNPFHWRLCKMLETSKSPQVSTVDAQGRHSRDFQSLEAPIVRTDDYEAIRTTRLLIWGTSSPTTSLHCILCTFEEIENSWGSRTLW